MKEIKKFHPRGLLRNQGFRGASQGYPAEGNHHTFITGNARCAVLENGNPKSTRCWSMTVTGESP